MYDFLLANFVQIPQFLSLEERSQLLEYVLDQQDNFVPTTTSTGAIDYRKSKILYEFPEFAELMRTRVKAALPTVFDRLPDFPAAEIELQLTAHNDGNYYKIHNDNGAAEVADRELTYVYYFYREPKRFTGGELRLYNLKIADGYYQAADSFYDLDPENNSILFFPSHYMHEVLPVSCPSQSFADSRFTLNGWIRRQSLRLE
jgi:Rps23 Pro-64 3,4-dihydroxylase Tpa1-like proline 4-hydroxylase